MFSNHISLFVQIPEMRNLTSLDLLLTPLLTRLMTRSSDKIPLDFDELESQMRLYSSCARE